MIKKDSFIIFPYKQEFDKLLSSLNIWSGILDGMVSHAIRIEIDYNNLRLFVSFMNLTSQPRHLTTAFSPIVQRTPIVLQNNNNKVSAYSIDFIRDIKRESLPQLVNTLVTMSKRDANEPLVQQFIKVLEKHPFLSEYKFDIGLYEKSLSEFDVRLPKRVRDNVVEYTTLSVKSIFNIKVNREHAPIVKKVAGGLIECVNCGKYSPREQLVFNRQILSNMKISDYQETNGHYNSLHYADGNLRKVIEDMLPKK